MPTKQSPDEAELSRLLSQGEPPESPEHLDDTILQYAKSNAPIKEKDSFWLPQPWAAAAATLSIAAIAISVGISSFNSGDLDRSLSETVPLQVATSDAVLDEAIEVETTVLVREQQLATAEDSNIERQVAQNIATLASSTADEPEETTAGDLNNANTVVEEQEPQVAFSASAAAAPVSLNQAQIEESTDAISADDSAGLQALAAADVDTANEAEVQSGLAAAPQLARRATSATVSTQALSIEAIEAPVAITNLPALLTLMEELLEDNQQGTREERDQAMIESERANQLQQLYSALSEEELEGFNSAYEELLTSFSDFTLPSTLASAIEQVQQLSN